MKYLAAFLFLVVITPKISFSQEVKKPRPIKYIFDPAADPKKDVQQALVKAKTSHKNVLIVVGGDWNYWSVEAYHYLVDSIHCEKNFELALVNFSATNKNEAYLTDLQCPRTQGYPILIVLDENGKKLDAEDTDKYKLNKKDYSIFMLKSFVYHWTK